MAFKDSDIDGAAWYSVEQTAEFISVSPQSVRRHIKEKRLRAEKMSNGRLRVGGKSIREFLGLDRRRSK